MSRETERRETEAQFQSAVVDYAKLKGWMVHHTRPAQTCKGWRTPIQGDPGYPDLTMARDGKVVWAELKSEKGKLSDAQIGWCSAIGPVHVWRPSDWDTVLEVLA